MSYDDTRRFATSSNDHRQIYFPPEFNLKFDEGFDMKDRLHF